MDKKFLLERFSDMCATNHAELHGPVRGIVLRFHGLGHKVNLATDMVFKVATSACTANGILFIFPFYNPWSWMNKKTVDFIDALLDVARDLYQLDKDIPLGIYGGSMGGYSALTYAIEGKHKVKSIALNCPCCNMEYELLDHKQTSITRSYFESAMSDCTDFPAYIRAKSPLNRIAELPRIPYRFAMGLKDATLHPEKHGLAMASEMEAAGLDVSLKCYAEMGHCNHSEEDYTTEYTWLCHEILQQSN